ncbi:hypothetical protein BCR33DRAFT_447265 [Rhizoclosmatium globosum]|uniref:Uncharacterized protein n=1 Tax=Rhizoclosmatium globosum TaxID=329046 RepID=A0A1Y2BS64_9FUNG|nr:hypothetical protein BCR33DRAFT_447265 [Rhizoclosmatium globosum]|eukprot:ORY37589.1 hypothetical protein BCR33DRAFT_447265 [Rhizoclosmatium globosum]
MSGSKTNSSDTLASDRNIPLGKSTSIFTNWFRRAKSNKNLGFPFATSSPTVLPTRKSLELNEPIITSFSDSAKQLNHSLLGRAHSLKQHPNQSSKINDESVKITEAQVTSSETLKPDISNKSHLSNALEIDSNNSITETPKFDYIQSHAAASSRANSLPRKLGAKLADKSRTLSVPDITFKSVYFNFDNLESLPKSVQLGPEVELIQPPHRSSLPRPSTLQRKVLRDLKSSTGSIEFNEYAELYIPPIIIETPCSPTIPSKAKPSPTHQLKRSLAVRKRRPRDIVPLSLNATIPDKTFDEKNILPKESSPKHTTSARRSSSIRRSPRREPIFSFDRDDLVPIAIQPPVRKLKAVKTHNSWKSSLKKTRAPHSPSFRRSHSSNGVQDSSSRHSTEISPDTQYSRNLFEGEDASLFQTSQTSLRLRSSLKQLNSSSISPRPPSVHWESQNSHDIGNYVTQWDIRNPKQRESASTPLSRSNSHGNRVSRKASTVRSELEFEPDLRLSLCQKRGKNSRSSSKRNQSPMDIVSWKSESFTGLPQIYLQINLRWVKVLQLLQKM